MSAFSPLHSDFDSGFDSASGCGFHPASSLKSPHVLPREPQAGWWDLPGGFLEPDMQEEAAE